MQSSLFLNWWISAYNAIIDEYAEQFVLSSKIQFPFAEEVPSIRDYWESNIMMVLI